MVALRAGRRLVAAAVDELLGKSEIVIKSLGAFLDGVGPWSGATVSGEGRVILLLDPTRLAETRRGDAPRIGAPRPVPTRPGAPPREAPRVLLVDDSLSVRKFVGLMLERAGFEVRMAADGGEALNLLADSLVDVVVTDLEMPRVNGFELVQDLRRRPETRALPVVVLTTRAGEKHLELARRLGVEHYVTKPVDERAFVALVAALASARTPGRRAVTAPAAAPVRVLVAGDSRAMRGALRRTLTADPRFEVVGMAADADQALRALTRRLPDVIVIDVGMDASDAIDTIGRVMAVHPIPVVVMSATTPEGGEAAIRAMEAGAVDVVAKPSWSVDPGLAALASEIVRKILAAARVRPARITAVRPGERPAGASHPGLAAFAMSAGSDGWTPCVVIAASTGGPAALLGLIPEMPRELPAAVLVVQHMPAPYTQAFARLLGERSSITVREAAAGDRSRPRRGERVPGLAASHGGSAR